MVEFCPLCDIFLSPPSARRATRSDMAQAATIQNEVTEAVNAYVLWQRSDIGKDINPSELEHRIRAAGAKRAVIRSPAFTVVSTTEAAQPGTVNLVYGGLEDD